MTSDKAWEIAQALITAREVVRLETQPQVIAPVVQTVPALTHEYATAVRLTSSTATRQTITWRSGFTGTLEGITVFTDAVDPGDTWSATLRGKALKENIYPVANTAIEEDLSEPIRAGDSIVLFYNSQGTTVKHIDFTPRVRYQGEGL